ncbi:hypothetical protein NDU88_005213 [Pleurodeles waltl]|uniref:Uncharacterized protein n=1 Tax=Pleurodeles waltl TaxID=8319 RepID=A0AAV7RKB7_PLEWA|nr:hypothetical protein NDU88_005213 [Pleurodeles waltl]
MACVASASAGGSSVQRVKGASPHARSLVALMGGAYVGYHCCVTGGYEGVWAERLNDIQVCAAEEELVDVACTALIICRRTGPGVRLSGLAPVSYGASSVRASPQSAGCAPRTPASIRNALPGEARGLSASLLLPMPLPLPLTSVEEAESGLQRRHSGPRAFARRLSLASAGPVHEPGSASLHHRAAGGKVGCHSGEHLLQPRASIPGPKPRGSVWVLPCPVCSLNAMIVWRQGLSAVQGTTPAGRRHGRRSKQTAAAAQHSGQRWSPDWSYRFL